MQVKYKNPTLWFHFYQQEFDYLNNNNDLVIWFYYYKIIKIRYRY